MEEEFVYWVKELTKGSSVSSVSDGDFSQIMKMKSLHPVFTHMMKHLRPIPERRHIRLNLKHAAIRKRLLEDKDISLHHKKHASLSSLLQDTRAAIAMDVKEIHNIAETEEILLQREKELRCKILLVKESIENKKSQVEMYKSWNCDIPLLIPKYTKPSINPQENSIQEEELKERLQLILSKLKNFRIRLLKNEEIDLHQEKADIWDLVEKLQMQYPPNTILKVLCSISTSCTDDVDNLTNEVDIIRDAKALRIKQESLGGFIDELGNLGELETVQMLLVQMSGNHIKKHLKNHSLKKEIKLTSDSLDTVKHNINAAIKKSFEDESLVPEIMTLLDETLKLAGSKAAVSKAASLSKELDERAAVAKRAQQILLDKHSKIHLFDTQVRERVFQLKCLASSASDSLKNLQNLLSDILSVVESESNSITVPIAFISSIISKELDALLRLPFEILHTLETEHGLVPVPSLGPLHSYSKNPDLKNKIGSTLTSLTPVISTWDHLIMVLWLKKMQLKHFEEVVAKENTSLEDMMDSSRNKKSSGSYISDLCSEVKEKDKVLEEKVISLLKVCEHMNSNNLSQLLRVESVINDWWNQPAQHIKDVL